MDAYLEIGKKKTFASVIDWPGWSRSGANEPSALEALVNYGPRYALVMESTGLVFVAPEDPASFTIIERLAGSPVTDFGAPERPYSGDSTPLEPEEFQRLVVILQACWRAFDQTVVAAGGKTLTKGPRGGGRELDRIVLHVLEADRSYLSKIGGKFKLLEGESPDKSLLRLRETILATLPRKASGEIPDTGPRGGAYWSPRYFVRRSTWHILDHLWEIEDRSI